MLHLARIQDSSIPGFLRAWCTVYTVQCTLQSMLHNCTLQDSGMYTMTTGFSGVSSSRPGPKPIQVYTVYNTYRPCVGFQSGSGSFLVSRIRICTKTTKLMKEIICFNRISINMLPMYRSRTNY